MNTLPWQRKQYFGISLKAPLVYSQTYLVVHYSHGSTLTEIAARLTVRETFVALELSPKIDLQIIDATYFAVSIDVVINGSNRETVFVVLENIMGLS